MERIAVENLSKKFKIGYHKNQGSLGKIVSLLSGKEPTKELVALDGVSFKVNSGEVLGVIGSNGSGKSTLLRVICNIYKKDSGNIYVNGKIISLINLYAGMRDRITMKDSIYLISSLFGMNKKEIDKKIDKIISFSGLVKFIDTKLYQFSNGMLERLAFSIAINCDPEILLLDEVFEVGDEDFKEKSVQKIKEIVNAGACVLLVSHDISLLRKHCSRLLWLKAGKVVKIGPTQEIIAAYLNEND